MQSLSSVAALFLVAEEQNGNCRHGRYWEWIGKFFPRSFCDDISTNQSFAGGFYLECLSETRDQVSTEQKFRSRFHS